MGNTKIAALMLFTILGCLLSACGGSRNSTGPETSDGLSLAVPDVSELYELPGEVLLPRDSAAVFNEFMQGSAFYLKSDNAQVEGESLLLQPGANEMSWAIYGIPAGGNSVRRVDVQGENMDGGFVWLAAANQTETRWNIQRSLLGADSVVLEGLEQQGDSYESDSGIVYIAVIAWNTDAFRITGGGFQWEGELGAPDDFSASDGSFADRIELSWDFPGNAADFVVERSETPNGPFVQIAETASENYSDFHDPQDNPLPEEQLFHYRVRAKLGELTGPPSVVDSGYRSFDALSGFFTCRLNQAGVLLVWDPPPGGLEAINIYRDEENTLLLSIPGASRHYLDVSASSEHAHQYWIRPVVFGVAGPPSGPLVSSRAVWSGGTIGEAEGFSSWGRELDLAEVDGAPTIAYFATQNGQECLAVSSASTAYPLGGTDFLTGLVEIDGEGGYGAELALVEFQGLPLVVFSRLDGTLMYAYPASEATAEPADWIIRSVTSQFVNGYHLDAYDYDGVPVLAFVVTSPAVFDPIEAWYVSGESDGILSFERIPGLTIIKGNWPRLARLEGRLCITYGDFSSSSSLLSWLHADSSDITQVGAFTGGIMGSAGEVIDTAITDNIQWMSLAYIRTGTAVPITGVSPALGDAGMEGWKQMGLSPVSGELGGVELLSACGNKPSIFWHSEGQAGYWYPMLDYTVTATDRSWPQELQQFESLLDDTDTVLELSAAMCSGQPTLAYRVDDDASQLRFLQLEPKELE